MSVPPRAQQAAVAGVLGSDYNGTTDLRPYIARASALVDHVAAMAATRGFVLSSIELQLIEETIAAHFYTKMDPVYQQRSTDKASAGFVRGDKNAEPYKDMAIQMDPSGAVNSVLNQLRASAAWLGKPPSQQINYEDRD